MTKRRNISAYQGMWLFALFDLPVDSKAARRQYTRFRTELLKEGFSMLQFSVYARYCQSEERANQYRKRIRQALPPAGEVRLMAITDRQYGKMEVFLGKKRTSTEEPPQQLLLF